MSLAGTSIIQQLTLIGLVTGLLKKLRHEIGEFLEEHPDRLLFDIPFERFPELQELSPEDLVKALGGMSHYVGAALPEATNDEPKISHTYQVTPFIFAQGFQVFLLPENRIVNGVPAKWCAEAFAGYVREKTDDVTMLGQYFSVMIPGPLVEHLSAAKQPSFKGHLERRLKPHGIQYIRGTYYGSVEFRKVQTT